MHEGFRSEKIRADHDGGWAQILGVLVLAGKAGFTVASLARAAAEMQKQAKV